MKNTPQCYDVRTFLIYIDSYENGIPTGQYHNPSREEIGIFDSLTQLLLKIDQSLDIEDIPQAFHSIRTFTSSGIFGTAKSSPTHLQKGIMATFMVHILFRRNASWQGSLIWLDERKSQSFRSVLELIFLIDSALSGAKYSNMPLSEHVYGELA